MFAARLKHFFAVICVLSFLFLLLPQPIFAETVNLNTNSDVRYTVHNNTQVFLIETTSALICQLIGIDIVNPNQPCLGINTSTNKIGYVRDQNNEPLSGIRVGGALGTVTTLIGTAYKVPIHLNDYTSYLTSNFGFAKPVYAQTGTGFQNLSSLMGMWTKIRDLTYFAFVLVFVLIGLSIMLRVRIDPKTVMSIQSQLPKIIVALLLITLSYAIVGLLIDFMWVTTYTGINLLTGTTQCQSADSLGKIATVNLLDTPINYISKLLGCPFPTVGIQSAIFGLAGAVGQTLGDIVMRAVIPALGFNTDVPVDASGCYILSFNMPSCFHYIRFEFSSWIVGNVATLAIIIAIFVQLFRIWFALIKSYVYLILYTLLGPIWILLGLFPGTTNYGFTNWIRHILFSLSIYPVTIFIFIIAAALASDPQMSTPLANMGNSFVPPLVANPAIAYNMGYILALAAILITPEVINMMREAFKAPASKHTATIFAGLGVGAAAVSAPIKGANSALWARDSAGNAKGPLAFASQTATGSLTRGFAHKFDQTFNTHLGQKAWERNYGQNAIGMDYDKKSSESGNKGNGGGQDNPPPTPTTIPPVGPSQGGGSGGATTDVPVGENQTSPNVENLIVNAKDVNINGEPTNTPQTSSTGVPDAGIPIEPQKSEPVIPSAPAETAPEEPKQP
jgi:hypothetical protein